MKQWSLNFWNDWRYVNRNIVDVTVLRVNADYLRSHYVSVDFVLLGFGFSLSYYFDPAGTQWHPVEDGILFVPVESLGRDS